MEELSQSLRALRPKMGLLGVGARYDMMVVVLVFGEEVSGSATSPWFSCLMQVPRRTLNHRGKSTEVESALEEFQQEGESERRHAIVLVRIGKSK